MTPRLISKQDAAAYCGLSMTQFSQWIAEGRISPAIPGTHRFDKLKLDADLDRLSGIKSTPELSPLEKWKAERNVRAAQRPSHVQKEAR
jgi:hypothetical protein